MSSVKKVLFDRSNPDESTEKLHLIYSDYGIARVEIFAAKSETFRDKKHITKMHDSLRVNFFSSNGIIVSRLTALYGEIDHTSSKIIVRDSVRLTNFAKNQTLETEALIWNQNDSTIYSVSQVIIKTPKGTFYGDGIRTKQDFSYYEIINPKGSIQLEEQLKLE
jgi:LPS export ABC transporter protein LptC